MGDLQPVTVSYFALGRPDQGRANIGPFLRLDGRGDRVHGRGSGLLVGGRGRGVGRLVRCLGVDEIVFNPATDDVDEVRRLAKIVF
jgi:hypothetical protein